MSKRSGMQPVGSWRGYFAPVDRGSGAVTIFDGRVEFDVDAPPAPWIEVGWIRNLKRSGTVDLESVATGTAGLAGLRFRKRCEGRVEFDFGEWGKLQMALAAASQHVNLLSGGAFSVTGGSDSVLEMAAESLANFAAGDLVAVDIDHGLENGYIGTGVTGAFLRDAFAVDNDYVRAISFNVGKVKEKTESALVLDSPLLGGIPLAGAKAQKVCGYFDREGASFLQEWSALFVMDEVAGGRVALWYPRLQTTAEPGETRETIEGEVEQLTLHAKFAALPIIDELDGERAVSYRFYWPAAAAAAY